MADQETPATAVVHREHPPVRAAMEQDGVAAGVAHAGSVIEQACGRAAKRRLLPMQPGDVRDTFADIGAIQRDLGFEPRTTIAEGVPHFVEWYRTYHKS